MSDSARPHRQQPTRLPRPWDSPGKNTGVGCHFLLQCMKVKSLSCVQLLATLWTAAHQAPPSMGFSRQEYWSGVPLPSLEGNISKHKFQENGYICGSSTKTTQRAPKLAVIFFKLGSRSLNVCYCSLVQFSHSVVSDSL